MIEAVWKGAATCSPVAGELGVGREAGVVRVVSCLVSSNLFFASLASYFLTKLVFCQCMCDLTSVAWGKRKARVYIQETRAIQGCCKEMTGKGAMLPFIRRLSNSISKDSMYYYVYVMYAFFSLSTGHQRLCVAFHHERSNH